MRLSDAAPLFEKKGHIFRSALGADITNPSSFHRASTRPAFATDDNPVDAFELNRAEMFQERLNGKETDFGWSLAQQINPGQTMLPVFNAHAPPNVILLGGKTKFAFQQLFKRSARLVRTW